MDLSDSDILDLMKGTLKELGRNTFFQIAQNLQEYEVMSRWLRKDKVVFDEGVGIQRTLMTKLAGAAKHTGLFEADDVNLVDLLEQMSIGWVQAQTYWMWERRELLKNRGKALVQNVIKPRREGAMIDLAAELESKGWACPAVGSKVEPNGIPYYVVKNASTGFHGGAPTGYTTVAGINPTNTPGWKNYTGTFSVISKEDWRKKLKTAARKTRFVSPLASPAAKVIAHKFRYYTTETNISDIEDLAENNNDNLRIKELDNVNGDIVFQGNPIKWVPELDSDSDNPFYGINHGTFYPVVLKGDYLREAEPSKAPNQHNVYIVFVDLSYNFLCVDRRRNLVLYKA